jgi:hypothetical protein
VAKLQDISLDVSASRPFIHQHSAVEPLLLASKSTYGSVIFLARAYIEAMKVSPSPRDEYIQKIWTNQNLAGSEASNGTISTYMYWLGLMGLLQTIDSPVIGSHLLGLFIAGR